MLLFLPEGSELCLVRNLIFLFIAFVINPSTCASLTQFQFLWKYFGYYMAFSHYCQKFLFLSSYPSSHTIAVELDARWRERDREAEMCAKRYVNEVSKYTRRKAHMLKSDEILFFQEICEDLSKLKKGS